MSDLPGAVQRTISVLVSRNLTSIMALSTLTQQLCNALLVLMPLTTFNSVLKIYTTSLAHSHHFFGGYSPFPLISLQANATTTTASSIFISINDTFAPTSIFTGFPNLTLRFLASAISLKILLDHVVA